MTVNSRVVKQTTIPFSGQTHPDSSFEGGLWGLWANTFCLHSACRRLPWPRKGPSPAAAGRAAECPPACAILRSARGVDRADCQNAARWPPEPSPLWLIPGHVVCQLKPQSPFCPNRCACHARM